MIREFTRDDLEQVMKLWLETNKSAHAFISQEYWQENYLAVKKAIPEAKVYIYEEHGEIEGFLGLDGEYIAGIFVDQTCQSRGIGKELIAAAKQISARLWLQVYEKNRGAIRFYQREGFCFLKKQMDETTGEMEWIMEWVG